MALAAEETGAAPLALTFDYGQRHRAELDRAAGVAGHYRSEHLVVHLDTSAWGGSALTDRSIDVPAAGSDGGIPVTYVPARNSIFLAVALGVAEARDLDANVHNSFIQGQFFARMVGVKGNALLQIPPSEAKSGPAICQPLGALPPHKPGPR